MTWHSEGKRCLCDDLPTIFEDRNVQNVVEVAGSVDMESERLGAGGAYYYRCLSCGQWWRDGIADDHALRKVPSIE